MYQIVKGRSALVQRNRTSAVRRVTKKQTTAKPSTTEKYPFYQLKVGHSFLVEDVASLKSLNGSMWRASKKYGRRFVSRELPSGTIQVTRVA